jgi:hypothetical protein
MQIVHHWNKRVCDPMAVKAKTSAAKAAASTAKPRSLPRG